MNRWKLSPLVTVTISLHMIVSPVAFAQQQGQRMNALDMINMAGQLIQQNQAQIAAQRQAQADQQLVAEMTAPGEDKHFSARKFPPLPGFNPAVMNCATLPSTVTEIRAEVCRLGVTNDRGAPPQVQLAEMFSLYKTYGDVAKAYEGYQSTTSPDQGFGIGCMQNAVQALSSYLAGKISELDKTMMDITVLNDQFKEASRVDLDAIAEATAVLDGGNGELVNEVRSKRPDLFEFDKRFNNPACKSMFEGDRLNTVGRGRPGGLNQISKVMRDEYAAKPAGSKFSAESYVGAHGTVVADINKMADKAAEQFRLNFTSITGDARGYGQFLGGLSGSVSSTSGLAGLLRGDFFSDAQQSFNKENADITANLQLVRDELSAAGVDPQRAIRAVNNLTATNFESEVGRIQTEIQNSCVRRSISNWDTIKDRIVDPDASRFANSTYDSFRNEVQRIMTNPTTSPEQKVADLQRLERSSGSRFILNLQAPYSKSVVQNGQVVTTTVNPGAGSPPSAYFNDVIGTCQAQFQNNKLGSTLTGAGALQTLRTVNQQYQRLATNQANQIRNEIRRKLIECETSNEANNQQAGSCTRERFNTNSAGFCANAAFTCANNMKSCSTQAQTFVTQIKNERTARVSKYKQNMERNRLQMKGIATALFRDYSAIGAALGGLNLGATFGFATPNLETSGQGQYLDKFQAATQNSPDGALLLEDPDKYVDMLKTNVESLKRSFTQLQQGLTGPGGVLAKHIQATQRSYGVAAGVAKNISESCIQKHDEFIRASEQQRQQQMAEMQKRQTELGEKRDEICALYTRAQFDANGACNERVTNITAPIAAAYGEFQGWCASNGFNNNQGNSSGAGATNAYAMCLNVNESTPPQPAPSSGDSQSESRQIPQTLSGLCAEYMRLTDTRQCTTRQRIQNEDGSESNPPRYENVNQCSDLVVAIEARYARERGQAQNGDGPPAPAECSAGFNGDRNAGEGLMDEASRRNAVLGALGVSGI